MCCGGCRGSSSSNGAIGAPSLAAAVLPAPAPAPVPQVNKLTGVRVETTATTPDDEPFPWWVLVVIAWLVLAAGKTR